MSNDTMTLTVTVKREWLEGVRREGIPGLVAVEEIARAVVLAARKKEAKHG